jgi:transposase
MLHTMGIDLGKTVFHLVGLKLGGEVIVRKKCSRKQLRRFAANLKVELVGMEALWRAHFLGRVLREQGHEVRLIPAQYVKPYVKTNKSDYIDAEAIAEAVGRPRMRFVPIKTDDQLDLQSLHRVRERWVRRRTAVINQIRGLLLEPSPGTTRARPANFSCMGLVPSCNRAQSNLRSEHMAGPTHITHPP